MEESIPQNLFCGKLRTSSMARSLAINYRAWKNGIAMMSGYAVFTGL